MEHALPYPESQFCFDSQPQLLDPLSIPEQQQTQANMDSFSWDLLEPDALKLSQFDTDADLIDGGLLLAVRLNSWDTAPCQLPTPPHRPLTSGAPSHTDPTLTMFTGSTGCFHPDQLEQRPPPAPGVMQPPASTTTSISSSFKSAAPAGTASAKPARGSKGAKGSKGASKGRGGRAGKGRTSGATSKGKGATQQGPSGLSPFLQPLTASHPTASIIQGNGASIDQELEAAPPGVVATAMPSSLLPSNSLRLKLGLAMSIEPLLHPGQQPSLLANLPDLEEVIAGLKAAGVKQPAETVPSSPSLPPPLITEESSGVQVPPSALSRQGSTGEAATVAVAAENATPAPPPALHKGETHPVRAASPVSGITTRSTHDTTQQQQKRADSATKQQDPAAPPLSITTAPSVGPAGTVVLPKVTVTRRPPTIHGGAVPAAPPAPAMSGAGVDMAGASSGPSAATKQSAGQSTERKFQAAGDGTVGQGRLLRGVELAGLPDVPLNSTGMPPISAGGGYVNPLSGFFPGMSLAAAQQLLLPPLVQQQQQQFMPAGVMTGAAVRQTPPSPLLDLGGGPPAATAGMQTSSTSFGSSRRSPVLVAATPALAHVPPQPVPGSPLVLTDAHQALLDGLQALLNLPPVPGGSSGMMTAAAPAVSVGEGSQQAGEDGAAAVDKQEPARVTGKRKAERPPPAPSGGSKRGRGRGGRRGGSKLG